MEVYGSILFCLKKTHIVKKKIQTSNSETNKKYCQRQHFTLESDYFEYKKQDFITTTRLVLFVAVRNSKKKRISSQTK